MRISTLKLLTACVLCAGLGAAAMRGVLQSREPDRDSGSISIGATRALGSDAALEPGGASRSRLDALGDWARAMAGRPAARRELGLTADMLVRLAESDPRAAMDAVLELDAYWHRIDTADRIAALWARRDPHAALAYARASNELAIRSTFETRVVEEWARVDPERALGHLLTPQGELLFLRGSGRGTRLARRIASRLPQQSLAAANRLPTGIVRSELREAAIESIVHENLASALWQASTETPGADQAQWIEAITRVYAEQDPAGALQWARDLEFAVPGTLNDVVAAVYAAYPDRLEELRLCALNPRVTDACRP